MRFFLIDKVKEIIPQQKARGFKCWSLDNEIFQDHFPGHPTVPGVLLTESMAQLSGILIEESYKHEFKNAEKVYPVLSIIQKAKFRDFVEPGDQCLIDTELLSLDKDRATCKIKTFVDEKLMCEATISFFIIQQKEMNDNPYLKKREEYIYSIMPKK
jgi:3-hydroxymyristoyl/3-hydroxydecanoyl-(acyl carrier protein) dehydratase